MKIRYHGGMKPMGIIECGYDGVCDRPEDLAPVVAGLKEHGYCVTQTKYVALVNIGNREEYERLREVFRAEKRRTSCRVTQKD